ncbi:MAG: Binding-protein-dependent transport system inner membrane component, partial [Parcubacteria group bacterium GW2011_GWD2_43_10]
LKVFEQVYILTNGGPGNRTQVVGTWIYKMFGYGNWGMGNALNILLTLIIAVIVILSLSILRQKEVEL